MAGMKQLPKLAEAIALFFKQNDAERMATAQQRAALPLYEGGLGLPADNTAAQRADAMFPTSVWRGAQSVNLFDEKHLNDPRTYPRAGNTYRDDHPVFSTPSNALAQTYGPNVYPMRLDTRGYLNTDYEGRNYLGLDFDHNDLDAYPPDAFEAMDSYDSDLREFATDRVIYDGDNNGIIATIESAKTDDIADWMFQPNEVHNTFTENWNGDIDWEIPGVKISNIIDIGGKFDEMPPHVKQQLKEPQTVYLGRNKQYRHVDAAFDPFLKDWDHILAGAAGTGILLDQIPYDEQKQGALYAE